MKHYEHIQDAIVAFFAAKGVEVEIEPSGSRGPDVRGVNTVLVGEVKHETELRRDLHCKFWKDWNSTQHFGGKTTDYRLAEHLPTGADRLDDNVRGWLAVIWGQLRYMVKDAGLSEGWIVYENHYSFEQSLLEATAFLAGNSLLYADSPEHQDNIGFCKMTYTT
jgi:hypothetical protein